MLGTRRAFLLRAVRGAAGTALAAAGGRIAGAKQRRRKRPEPLFRDRFRRRDRDGWGAPWFNQRYGRHWMIKGGKGIFRLPASETSMRYRPNPVLVLDRDVAALDLRAVVARSNPTGRVGLVARAKGYADYYACYLTGDGELRLVRCGYQDERLLAKTVLPFPPVRKYRLRLQIKGRGRVHLRVKAWPEGGREPSAWSAAVTDSSDKAISGGGAFGLLFAHATDGRGCTFTVSEVVAWSGHKRATTAPHITYACASPAVRRVARVVVKTAVPASVWVEYGPDPTFTHNVRREAAGRTSRRAQTAKAKLDVSGFAGGTTVYWRPVARRGRHTKVGPTSSFRTPPGDGLPVRFAFGACTRWNSLPRRSFEQVRRRLPDFFLHQGDFGYVANRVVAHAPDCYQDHWTRMLVEPNFAAMARAVPLLLTRDDAEYGVDSADRETMRRFVPGAHGEMQANPRNHYFDFRYGDIHFFVVDCRRYSSGKVQPPSRRTKLGKRQKSWLKRRMRAVAASGDVGLLVVCSPMSFGSDLTPASWRRAYHDEWSELMEFFQSLNAAVLILSGNVHGHRIHDYPQKNLPPGEPRVVEFQSAGTEQNKWSHGVDEDVAVKRAMGSGFGLVEIGPEQEINGQRARTLTLSAVRSTDGRTFWPPSHYLIVRNVGIFPLGA